MQGPDFIIIGAQRSGTTSLYNYLIEHQNIKSTSQKEIHYFDNNYDKGLTWYSKKFPSIRKGIEITGEASPYYIFHPHAVNRISKDFPNVKLIVLLRNPIERAYSHYCMAIKKGNDRYHLKKL